jgi:DNA helicase HerA-like ATPase
LHVKLNLLSGLQLEGHLLVVGPTGSGKTNTVKVILEQLAGRVPALVLDYHGEYRCPRVYTPGRNLRFNMLASSSQPDLEFLVDVLSTVFQLTEPQWYVLVRAAKKVEPPYTLQRLVEAVEEEPARDWREFEVKQALLRRLMILNEGVLGAVLNGSEDPSFLFEDYSCVDLSAVPPKYRSLLALVLLRHLYDYFSAQGESDGVRHVTVIEEAWSVLWPRAYWEAPSIGERLFLELRKFGELLIAVSQRVEDVSPRVVRNCSVVLMHRPTRQDLEKVGCGGDEALLRRLRRGIALVVEPGCRVRAVRVRRARDAAQAVAQRRSP